MSLDALIAHYGLAAIFIGAGTEGEAAAVAGGIVAHRNLIPLWQVAAATFGGSLVTGRLLFLAARRFRNAPWITRQIARPACVAIMRAVETRPIGFILIYRFVFGARTLTPIVLGVSRLPALRFSLLNAVAAALWAAVFTGLGYVFGKTVEHLFGHLPSRPHLIMIGAVVIVILLLGYGLHRGRKAARAEA
jgi:membrane protein DedA with SNARE-associated domain